MSSCRQRLLVALYLGSVVSANLAVAAFGPVAVAPSSFLLVGLDLTARDLLHDAWSGRGLVPRLGVLIGAGAALSFALNRSAGRIALASFVAFTLAAIVDALVYEGLRSSVTLVRVNVSNLGSAVMDSMVFPTIAFGTLLPSVIAGQLVAKVAGGMIWSLLLLRITRGRGTQG